MDAKYMQALIEIVTLWDWEQLIQASGATVFSIKVEDFKNVAL